VAEMIIYLITSRPAMIKNLLEHSHLVYPNPTGKEYGPAPQGGAPTTK
jgi:hypothetical protein